MTRLLLLSSCLLSLLASAQPSAPPAPPAEPPAAQAPPSEPAPAREETPREEGCVEEEQTRAEEELLSVLSPLQLRVEGTLQRFASVELRGLRHLSEEAVRALVGLPSQGPLAPEQVARVLARLARTGLFARVTPTVRLVEGAPPVLELVLEEQPYVASVDVRGLRDHAPEELLKELLRTPRRSRREDKVATLRLDVERGRLGVHWPCPRPEVPREWLARLEKDTVHPGLVHGGLGEALERALDELRDDGYLLASLSATLHPDGRLVLEVDEGLVEAVEVRGVDEALAPRVREALGLRPGEVFLRSDARRALKRLKARLPFLELRDVDVHEARRLRVLEERAEDGTRHYQAVRQELERPKRRRRADVELGLDWARWLTDEHGGHRPEGLTLEGRRVVVHVRPRRPDLDVDPLLVHTQVTGLAPGLEGALRVWDPRDRVHGTLEAAFFVPLRLGGQRIEGEPELTAFQRQLNWLAGGKVAVPALRLAEMGVEGYSFVDTLDRWRLGRWDSWLYSALINRPDADYFRRTGVTGFATLRPGEAWLAGVAVRRDDYQGLESFTPPLSLWRRQRPPFPNAPVDEGRLTSVTGRVEYASDAPPLGALGSLWRNPEVSLLDYERGWPRHTALRGLLTLEVGEARTGGPDERFWKAVSDNAFFFITGHDEGLRLRVRAAGGDNLPLQKREGLGGWTALRGYGFKELRGSASLLTSAEYRWGGLGAFVDVGTVRQEQGWTEPRLGVGAVLYLGEEVHLAAAWRTDERARLEPEVRLLFSRPF